MDYFQSDLDSADMMSSLWTKKSSIKTEKRTEMMVNKKKATITRVAIYALRNYYKFISTDPYKWNNFLRYDSHFVMFFALMKHCEHQGNFDGFDRYFSLWEALEFLPWGESKAYPQNPEYPLAIRIFPHQISSFN
jgi:hypothetical protein